MNRFTFIHPNENYGEDDTDLYGFKGRRHKDIQLAIIATSCTCVATHHIKKIHK